jgi:hypothetical protein
MYCVFIQGNIVAIAILMKMPKTSYSVYMSALDVVESLALIFLPLQDLEYIYPTDIVCQVFVQFAHSVFTMFSNWLIVAMTVGRFIAVKFPLKVAHLTSINKSLLTVAVMGV